MIEILTEAGSVSHELTAVINLLEDARTLIVPSFDPRRISLITELAELLLRRGQNAHAAMAIRAFAFWIRRAAVLQLKGQFISRLPAGTLALPRGVAFHLPPQNVATMFLYSWVISYLSGNANITRVPTSLSNEMRDVLGLILRQLASANDRSQIFAVYPVDDQINRAISKVSDARAVWGGNEKVKCFESMPLRLGGKAIWFGDRFSYAAIRGGALAQLDSNSMANLAAQFYNDVLLFDQMACASPRVLYIIGEAPTDEVTVERLMNALANEAHRRGVPSNPGQAIAKLTYAMALAAEGAAERVRQYTSAIITAEVRSRYNDIGGGFLQITYLNQLSDLIPLIADADQTLTYFGFSREAMALFAKSATSGKLSRIVPFGAALKFDVIWDGYDMISEFTRLLKID